MTTPFLIPGDIQREVFALTGKEIVGFGVSVNNKKEAELSFVLNDNSVLFFGLIETKGADGGIYTVPAMYLVMPNTNGERKLIWNG